MITSNLIETYKEKLGIDITVPLTNFVVFTQNHMGNIINYYSGIENIPNKKSFDFLNNLLQDFENLIQVTRLNRDVFITLEVWDLYESLDLMWTSLLTTSNISKFLRSSIKKGQLQNGLISLVGVNYNQTLEKIQQNINTNDFDNQWTNLAISNDLNEEKYTLDGGNVLRVIFSNNISTSQIQSIIDDGIEGEKLY